MSTINSSKDLTSSRYEYSILNLYKFGVGPSSSHTIGPMLAGKMFVNHVLQQGLLHRLNSISVVLYGSMSQVSGRGHKTPRAILLGMELFEPSQIKPEDISEIYDRIHKTETLNFANRKLISFSIDHDIRGNPQPLSEKYHAGMMFSGYDDANELIIEQKYFSIGGGYISSEDGTCPIETLESQENPKKYYQDRNICEFSMDVFADIREEYGGDIIKWILTYEKRFGIFQTDAEIHAHLNDVIDTMQQSFYLGIENEETHLEGYTQYPVVAPKLYRNLQQLEKQHPPGSLTYDLSLLQVGAISVSEINAIGLQRIVTAPTCGAAGVIPSLINYLIVRYDPPRKTLREFLMVGALLGTLVRVNASISGSDVGCQGEIGVATAMGAGAFAWYLGGSVQRIEVAASHALQQFLGMTCDPIAGYVQIPCINRNAFGATTSLGSATLAMNTPIEQMGVVRFDAVIEAVKRSGYYMPSTLKETSKEGLARTVKKTNLRAKLIGKEIL